MKSSITLRVMMRNAEASTTCHELAPSIHTKLVLCHIDWPKLCCMLPLSEFSFVHLHATCHTVGTCFTTHFISISLTYHLVFYTSYSILCCSRSLIFPPTPHLFCNLSYLQSAGTLIQSSYIRCPTSAFYICSYHRSWPG